MQWVILCLSVRLTLPDIGNLEIYKPPVGEGIRVDDGFEQGMDIPIYYDPMISKLATYGNTRNEAIKKMIFAIDNYHIKGVKTTLAFGKFVMQHPAFISGNFDTSFVEKYFHPNQINKEEIEIAIRPISPLVVETGSGTIKANEELKILMANQKNLKQFFFGHLIVLSLIVLAAPFGRLCGLSALSRVRAFVFCGVLIVNLITLL